VVRISKLMLHLEGASDRCALALVNGGYQLGELLSNLKPQQPFPEHQRGNPHKLVANPPCPFPS